MRLDAYCAGRFTYLSLSQWQQEILDGRLLLDGEPVHDVTTIVRGGEQITWDMRGIAEPAVDGSFAVLYEDQWLIAVDKPGNLPVHPAGRYFNHTLVAMLAERCGRPVYPVHRIDRETSGVLLLAFDGKNTGKLAASLRSKEYLALVHGEFPDGELRVALPLGPDPDSAVKKKRRAWSGGTESATTRFRRVHAVGDVSLVRCFPETGRMHQIRAHLHAAGYPIVGDKLYGRDDTAFLRFVKDGWTDDLSKRLILPRCALHAAELTCSHPVSGKEMVLRAPFPAMLSAYIRGHA